MSAIMRLTPDLTIVPSMVQSVEVGDIWDNSSAYGYSLTQRVGHRVVVRYLMQDEPVEVARFFVPYDSAFRSESHSPLGNLITVGAYVAGSEELAATEARAHVVYEAILKAVKEA